MILDALESAGIVVFFAIYGLAAGITWGRVGTWMERVDWHTLRHHRGYGGRLNRCRSCASLPLLCAALWPVLAPACAGIQFATKRRYSSAELEQAEKARNRAHIRALYSELGMEEMPGEFD